MYSSSEHLLLEVARLLTPAPGLGGTVSLVALGIITCLLQSAGIASLACGFRLKLRPTLLLAAALWLVMADAAFFDTYASPYSEGATLTGVLLVAAGLIYLRRGPLSLCLGLALVAAGGYLACLSKEQYDLLAIPVCIAVVAISARGRGLARFWHPRTVAATAVAAVIGVSSLLYAYDDATSPYATLLHQEQIVQMIFVDLITPQHGLAANEADLHALGLPASWASYAGDGFFAPHSVYHDPLYARYASKLTDTNLAGFLLSHPVALIRTGQLAADSALQFRAFLGSYSPAAGHPPGTLEDRVAVVSSLVSAIPAGLGLLWLIPLWAVMAALGWWTLRLRRGLGGWQADCGCLVLMLTGCAVAAFVPAAFFAGVVRHMTGANLATALAFVFSAVLLCSLVRHGIASAEPESEPEPEHEHEHKPVPGVRVPAQPTAPAAAHPAWR